MKKSFTILALLFGFLGVIEAQDIQKPLQVYKSYT